MFLFHTLTNELVRHFLGRHSALLKGLAGFGRDRGQHLVLRSGEENYATMNRPCNVFASGPFFPVGSKPATRTRPFTSIMAFPEI